MLSKERMKQISRLVRRWERKERQKEEYPSDANLVFTDLLGLVSEPCASLSGNSGLEPDAQAYFDRACREIGVPLQELKTWCAQDMQDAVRSGVVPSDELLEQRLNRMN